MIGLARHQGAKWFNGLEEAVLSLSQHPTRCPLAPETFDPDTPVLRIAAAGAQRGRGKTAPLAGHLGRALATDAWRHTRACSVLALCDPVSPAATRHQTPLTDSSGYGRIARTRGGKSMGPDGSSPSGHVTRLLRQWQGGDRAALDRLVPLIYEELRAIASRYMAHEWRQGTLQTTALVHEAYLKLVDQRAVDWQNRAHFFAIAAQVMRRILLDAARRRQRDKRGGAADTVPLDAVTVAMPGAERVIDVLAVDRALHDLEPIDPENAKIVELRFFGGLTVEETAAVLGVSPATIKREWAVAKGWLYRALTNGSSERHA